MKNLMITNFQTLKMIIWSIGIFDPRAHFIPRAGDAGRQKGAATKNNDLFCNDLTIFG